MTVQRKWCLASLVVLISGLFMVGCGGSSPGALSNGPTLAVTPKPAPAVTAGGAGANFVATLTGATDTINWSLDPATGSGTISSTTGATTTYTPPASVASSTTVTLTATAGTASDSVTITINPPATITVTGKVVALNGVPVANSSVVIGTQTTISATDGSFTIANVTTPYDLTSVVSSPSKYAITYKGLTRTDPTIIHFGVTGTLHSGTVTGDLSPYAPAVGFNTCVAWGSTEAKKNTGNITANPYTLNLSWYGPASTTGTLHALRWSTYPSGLPLSYSRYGEAPNVGVSNSSTTTQGIDNSVTVTRGNISGSVTLPTASYALVSKWMRVAFSSGAFIPIVSDSTTTQDFNYYTPASINGTITLGAQVKTSGNDNSYVLKSGLDAGAIGVTLAPQAASVQSLPANTGTGITTNTDFTWNAFTSGVHVVFLAPFLPASDPGFIVVTSGSTTKIPDLSDYGLTLNSAADYNWFIWAYAPWANVDDLAGGVAAFPANTSTLYSSTSAVWTFKTQ